MARNSTIKILRTTRANLNTQRTASGLIVGEMYLITDEGRIAIATAVNAYQVFAKGEEVGTVSQSSNIPTGAIIERGSNANGEFVKYADGTMMCWGKKAANASVAAGAAVLAANTLPATFVGDVSGGSDLIFYAGSNQTGKALYASRQSYSAVWNGAFINTGRSPADVVPSFTTIGSDAAASYVLNWWAVGRWF